MIALAFILKNSGNSLQETNLSDLASMLGYFSVRKFQEHHVGKGHGQGQSEWIPMLLGHSWVLRNIKPHQFLSLTQEPLDDTKGEKKE